MGGRKALGYVGPEPNIRMERVRGPSLKVRWDQDRVLGHALVLGAGDGAQEQGEPTWLLGRGQAVEKARLGHR